MLRELMLNEFARGLVVVREGNELVPTWRIMTPEGFDLHAIRSGRAGSARSDADPGPAFYGVEDGDGVRADRGHLAWPGADAFGRRGSDHDRRFADRTIGCHPAHSPHTGARLYAAGVASV